MHIARVGTFRQRNRRTENVSRQLRDQRKRRIAMQTHEAIDDFENVLRTTEAMDDPEYHRSRHGMMQVVNTRRVSNASSSGPGLTGSAAWWTSRGGLSGSRSMPHIDKDSRECRPPSPVKHHDYGCISQRPRSVTTQSRAEREEDKTRQHRQGSGFYFPGAQSTNGPYGSTLQDPILLAPNAMRDGSSRAPPHRWRDAGDIRPASAPDIDRRRSAGMPATSECVPSTRGHSHRAQAMQLALDRRREDAFLEQVCFENGVFEGRWKAPMAWENEPVQAPPPEFSWIEAEDDADAGDLREPRSFARRLLFGLEKLLRESRSKLGHVFTAEEQSSPGVLEASDFLHGLFRTGVFEFGEVTVKMLEAALVLIDDEFDGRVNLRSLGRAVAVAQTVRLRRFSAEQEAREQSQVRTKKLYHETLPIEAVKVERNARTIHTSAVQTGQFIKQQGELLTLNKNQTYRRDSVKSIVVKQPKAE